MNASPALFFKHFLAVYSQFDRRFRSSGRQQSLISLTSHHQKKIILVQELASSIPLKSYLRYPTLCKLSPMLSI